MVRKKNAVILEFKYTECLQSYLLFIALYLLFWNGMLEFCIFNLLFAVFFVSRKMGGFSDEIEVKREDLSVIPCI